MIFLFTWALVRHERRSLITVIIRYGSSNPLFFDLMARQNNGQEHVKTALQTHTFNNNMRASQNRA